MSNRSSQQFESFVPAYDVAPKEWDEEGRTFTVEQNRKFANAINVREIGFFLDEELLTGKQFIPGVNDVGSGSTSQQFRSILRKVIVFPGLSVGTNTQPHGISVDANFSLIEMFGSAVNSTALTGEPLPNGSDTISYTSTDVIINVANSYDRAWVTMEYIQEL